MRINPTLLPVALLIVAAGCQSKDAKAPTEKPPVTKLDIKDTVVGKGDPVQTGDDVWVRYKGQLANGSVFDQNETGDKDVLHVPVGAGQVIPGWDQGLVGMRKGGTRILSIPFMLAYGPKGKPPTIPPSSDLTFEIKLIDVLRAKDATFIDANDVPGKTGTGPAAKSGDRVAVDYSALIDGKSVEDRKAISFLIGGDDMEINGFDKAIIGMKVGGERMIKVPPELTPKGRNQAFGSNIVTYDVKLVKIN